MRKKSRKARHVNAKKSKDVKTRIEEEQLQSLQHASLISEGSVHSTFYANMVVITIRLAQSFNVNHLFTIFSTVKSKKMQESGTFLCWTDSGKLVRIASMCE